MMIIIIVNLKLWLAFSVIIKIILIIMLMCIIYHDMAIGCKHKMMIVLVHSLFSL